MKALSLLIKPASGSCNMRCRYCFYADVTNSREIKNRGLMPRGTLETLVTEGMCMNTRLPLYASKVLWGQRDGPGSRSGKGPYQERSISGMTNYFRFGKYQVPHALRQTH